MRWLYRSLRSQESITINTMTSGVGMDCVTIVVRCVDVYKNNNIIPINGDYSTDFPINIALSSNDQRNSCMHTPTLTHTLPETQSNLWNLRIRAGYLSGADTGGPKNLDPAPRPVQDPRDLSVTAVNAVRVPKQRESVRGESHALYSTLDPDWIVPRVTSRACNLYFIRVVNRFPCTFTRRRRRTKR